MDEDPLVLVAFYPSEESCDNGRTALGGTYTFMCAAQRTTVQNRTASNDHVQCSAVL